jgi:competence protein ComEA
LKDLWKFLFGAACAFLFAALIWLVSRQPQGQPVTLVPPPSPEPLTVHVAGAVVVPGVYRLPAESRVWDAVQAAGGFAEEADQNALNLAAFIEDGSKIEISFHQEITEAVKAAATVEVPPTPMPTAGIPTQTPYPRINFPININTASALELEQLPEIGQVRAARIVAYRQRNGLFKKIEDVRNVNDITPEVYAAIRDLITVGDQNTTLTPVPSD